MMRHSIKHNRRVRREGRGWLALYGAALLGLGFGVLVFPLYAAVSAGLLLGSILASYGMFAIASGFVRDPPGWADALLGTFALLAGIAILSAPVSAAVSIIWATGAWMLLSALWLVLTHSFFLSAAERRKSGRLWLWAIAIFDIVVGIIFLRADPATAITYVALMLAASVLIRGTFLLSMAISTKRPRAV